MRIPENCFTKDTTSSYLSVACLKDYYSLHLGRIKITDNWVSALLILEVKQLNYMKKWKYQ